MPTVTKNLLIINVLCFLGAMVARRYGVDLNDMLGLHFFLASDFNPAQLITYMFMHANFQHIFFNMFAVWMFGRTLEMVWGPKRFLFYYILCGIGAGASGAVYAILLAFGMLFPNSEMFIFPIPMPIKAKYFVIGYAVLELVLGISGGDGIAHFAHLGGMLFGLVLIIYWRKKNGGGQQIYY